jgi:hypothetical protein
MKQKWIAAIWLSIGTSPGGAAEGYLSTQLPLPQIGMRVKIVTSDVSRRLAASRGRRSIVRTGTGRADDRSRPHLSVRAFRVVRGRRLLRVG